MSEDYVAVDQSTLWPTIKPSRQLHFIYCREARYPHGDEASSSKDQVLTRAADDAPDQVDWAHSSHLAD